MLPLSATENEAGSGDDDEGAAATESVRPVEDCPAEAAVAIAEMVSL